jgi:hypothetical protein
VLGSPCLFPCPGQLAEFRSMRREFGSLSRPPAIPLRFQSFAWFCLCAASRIWTPHWFRSSAIGVPPPHRYSPSQALRSLRPRALRGTFRFSHANVPRTIKTLSKIEIKDAAINVLNTFSPTIPDDRPVCTTTKESSPICVSPAATAIAVRKE